MKVNDVVDIHNHSINGKPVYEGKAKLRRFWTNEPGYEYWEVQFVTDNHVADRWIKKPVDSDETERAIAQHESNRDTLDNFFSKI